MIIFVFNFRRKMVIRNLRFSLTVEIIVELYLKVFRMTLSKYREIENKRKGRFYIVPS